MLIVDPDAPAKLNQAELARTRMAADRALRLYPGPVGALVSGELNAWREFGYRFGNGKKDLIHRVVEQIMSTPMP